jgi:Arc/MetJ-type ribon-helix-helix transcriptional regulator
MSDLRRVQFDMPEQAVARLQVLKSKTEATSYSEVVKNALRLYEAIIQESEAGNSFLVRTPDGCEKQYLIF